MDLRFADDLGEDVRTALGYADAEDALLDPRGRTVRCTPRRRTIEGPVAAGITLYRKLREGGNAEREWQRLHELARDGFRVPRPVCRARLGRRSVVITARVPGRPLDAVLHEAVLSGHPEAAIRYCVERVAPMVRRLHDRGWFHRDLYWNHLYRDGADPGAEPSLIDVERVFRPLWRRRRWRVKDLAALWSSAPRGLPASAALRFLRAYLGGGAPSKRWVRAIARKAERMRRHRPKFG